MKEMEKQSYFDKILVAVDGAQASIQAEELTAEIAKKFKSKVTVMHVVAHDYLGWRMEPKSFTMSEEVVEEITGHYLQEGKGIIGNAVMLFKEEGIEAKTILDEYTDPAEAIIQEIGERKYDLVVIGNRGESEAETFSLGSIADKVVTHVACSAFIVKKGTKISKVLVATDGSEDAKKALKFAVQLASKFNADITLLNVQHSTLFKLRPDVTKEVGERILSEAVSEVKASFDRKLEFGNPAETIINVAEKGKYDLIVMGRRGQSAVKRFFLGGVSDDVSHHAKCSVLIVK
jgi:nucleotide-binding universal stress UspA family protein